jgi:DNA-binding XRE family transcriptional regulator
MTMSRVPDLWDTMDILPAESPGKAAEAVVPARIWNRLPAELRERFSGIRGVLGPPVDEKRPVRAWLVPVDRMAEIRDAIEDALDADLAEMAAADAVRDRAARARRGAEPAIPAEVVRAEIEGLSPIAAWRKYRGMTQVQLAEQLGIDRGYLAQLERGGRAGTPETIAKIARALGCLVEDLLEE